MRMSGSHVLPLDFLLDLQYAAYTLRDGLLSVQRVDVTVDTVLLVIRHTTRDGVTTTDQTITIPSNAAVPYRQTVTNAACTVTTVFGEGLATVAAWGVGAYLPLTYMQLEPALLVAQGRHRVAAFLGDTLDSVLVTGDVYCEEGYNTKITITRSGNRVVVAAIPDAGAGRPCISDIPGAVACADVLLMLNGAYGGASGAAQLVGGRGVAIEPDPDAHEIRVRTTVMAGDISCQKGRGV